MKSPLELVAAAKARITEIPQQDSDSAIATASVLIDVREPAEYAAGHIPGAVSMPRGLLEFMLASHPALAQPDVDVVLYCKTSGRSALAGASMADMGYTNVRILTEGFDGWAARKAQGA